MIAFTNINDAEAWLTKNMRGDTSILQPAGPWPVTRWTNRVQRQLMIQEACPAPFSHVAAVLAEGMTDAAAMAMAGAAQQTTVDASPQHYIPVPVRVLQLAVDNPAAARAEIAELLAWRSASHFIITMTPIPDAQKWKLWRAAREVHKLTSLTGEQETRTQALEANLAMGACGMGQLTVPEIDYYAACLHHLAKTAFAVCKSCAGRIPRPGSEVLSTCLCGGGANEVG